MIGAQEPPQSLELAVTELASPAGPSSSLPVLARGAGGSLYLAWTEERGDDGHALLLSIRADDAWSEARTIASGDDWFVNWADVPAIAALADGTLAATFLRKSAPDTYAYDVWLTGSSDGGATWSEPRVLHEDRSPVEHGFVSLVPLDAGRFGALWLDGRNTHGRAHGVAETSLFYREIGAGGELGPERPLDLRVCDCCPTSLVPLATGELVAAYRDRSADEIRDIALVRIGREEASAPSVPCEDSWSMPGCPVNGPRIAVHGDRIAMAWFTGAQGTSAVRVAAGSARDLELAGLAAADSGAPEGRVDVAFMADGSFVVSWLEHVEAHAIWMARVYAADGTRGPELALAATSSDRTSGHLRLLGDAAGVLAAWFDPGAQRVRVARLDVRP